MITTILLNGEPSDGRIPVTDSSVLRGDGCFEVLKSYQGKPFALDRHLDRLERSAKALEIELPARESLTDCQGERAIPRKPLRERELSHHLSPKTIQKILLFSIDPIKSNDTLS